MYQWGKKPHIYVDEFSKSIPRKKHLACCHLYNTLKHAKYYCLLIQTYSIKACMGMKNARISVLTPLGVGVKVGVKNITGETELYL